ncbi:MAG: hypothetical protein OXL97_07025 [Chloroflexota bacterium]|nr:hypothetical protein [Chloroflexota bacterium]MDE2885992.1 hypothetical protein [Chloroflexota bacterium]
MRLPIKVTALLALALVIGGVGVAASGLFDSTSPAQAAAAALDKSADEVRSALSDEVSPNRPLVIVLEIFQKGGYKVAPDGDFTSIATYGERVVAKEVLTPDADGNLVSITGELSNADGTPPVVEDLLGGSQTIGPTGNASNDNAELPPNPFPDADEAPGPTGNTGEYETDLADWLDEQLTLPQVIRDQGFTYVGRFELNGQPSIRYEYRETLGELPNGQSFDPPVVLVSVVEFVEANPLIIQESHYTVLKDGTLDLEEQTTVRSVTAGEPPAADEPDSSGDATS